MPLGASTSFGLGATSFNVNAYDLNRVEVLNGPQGTLFGSNSLGGTVRYITAAPDPRKFTAEGEAEVSSTEHGGINDGFRLNPNIPLPNEYGALRLDVINEYTSGYIDDPVYHRQDQGSFHSFGYRASLLLKPTEDIDVRLTGYSQRVPSQGAADEFRSPVTGRPTVGDYQQAFPVSQPSSPASISAPRPWTGTYTGPSSAPSWPTRWITASTKPTRALSTTRCWAPSVPEPTLSASS